MSERFTFARRALCAVVCVIMLASQAVLAEDENKPLPTPTPPPPIASAPEDEPTKAPTDKPTDNPTPTPKPTPEPTSAPTPTPVVTDTPEPEASETPSHTPEASATPGATPEASATPETSAEPSADPGASPSPSASPEASATPSKSPSPTPTATPEPTCTDENCPHVGLDDNGNPIALCPLGKQMLSVQTYTLMLASASAPTKIKLRDGKNTIYRSGSYIVTDGGTQAELDVATGLAVSIVMKDAQLMKLVLSKDVVATLGFEGENKIDTIAAPNATLTIDGKGCLYGVKNLNAKHLAVLGGSVTLPSGAVSENGRTVNDFNATGATSATVDGEAFPYTMPNPDDGKAHLWLPKLSSGSYTASVVGNTLTVTSLPKKPTQVNIYSLSITGFTPVANTAYRVIKGSTPLPQTLKVLNVDGVSLSFEAVDKACDASILADRALTVYLNDSTGFATLESSAALTLIGSGSLEVTALKAPALTITGGLTLYANTVSATPSGYRSIPVNGTLNPNVKAYYNGSRLPLVYATTSASNALLPLPAPAAGHHYSASLNGNKLTITSTPDGTTTLTLDNTGLSLSSGNYIIQSAGNVTGDLVIDDGANVTITLLGTHTTGKLLLGNSAQVKLQLEGSGSFEAGSQLGTNTSVDISGKGALLLGEIKGGSGCSVSVLEQVNLGLSTGSTLPSSSLKPNVITVEDDAGAPVVGKLITLKLGTGEAFDVTTDAKGRVTLWRDKALNNVSAVVLMGAETYAAVIINGKAKPDALPVISGVSSTKLGVVTFKTDIAVKSKGVMYMVNSKDSLPDAYSKNAKIALAGTNGSCKIPGLKDGDIVTYRAFASTGNTKLLAATQDAFAFSKQYKLTVVDKRKAFSLTKREKTYDKLKFELDQALLPKGSTIEYYHDKTKLSAAPIDVGNYIARVTVPEDDPKYLPGKVDVKMNIYPIKVLVCPDVATKKKGEPDPQFTFEIVPEEYKFKDGTKEKIDVSGRLTRRPGEAYGNYSYVTDKLITEDYYNLVVDENYPAFFIDWNAHHYIPFDPFAVIDPIYDELLMSNGKKLSTQIRTSEQLTINGHDYGRLVTDTIDNKPRPATPTLRLRGGYDSALLILTAEPELSKDGGYITDDDGRRVVHGRKLTLSYATLNRFSENNIDYIAFSLDGVIVLISLDDLRFGGTADEALKEYGLTHVGSTFIISMVPVTDESALVAGELLSAADAVRLKSRLMRVGVHIKNGDTMVDMTPWLTDATISFDASALMPTVDTAQQTDVVEMVDGKPIAKSQYEDPLKAAAIAAARGEGDPSDELMQVADDLFEEQMVRYNYSVCLYGEQAESLETKSVVPYTASEHQNAEFNALMRTKPYLSAELDITGLYGLTSNED